MERNRSFNLPDGNIPFGTAIRIKGSGLALGLTNGSTNYGLMKQLAGNLGILQAATGYYGVNAGDNVNIGNTAPNGQALGITSDGTKSGLVVDLSSAATVIIKY